MAKKKQKTAKPRSITKPNSYELDSVFILKILLFMVVGAQWLRITNGVSWQLPIPVGLIIGLIFASHDHFQIDRKIEYTILIMSMFVGFWLPTTGIKIIVM